MIQLIRNKDYYGIALFLLLVVMVGYQKMVSPAIGVVLLVILVELVFVKKMQFRFNKTTFLFVLLYLFYLVGLLWAEHKDVGWKLLEYKMSFFIFPILFLFFKEGTNVWNVLQGLVWGCIILVVRFVIGYYLNSAEEIPQSLISENYFQLHATYSSAYLTIASIFLVIGFYQKKIKWNLVSIVVVVFTFSYMIILMGSFAPILFLGILIVIALSIIIFRFTRWIGLVLFLIISPILGYQTISRIDVLRNDLELTHLVLSQISDGKEAFIDYNRNAESGTIYRVLMWYLAIEIIQENPFGVGTGDIDFFLEEKYEKYDLQFLVTHKLNPHNQFLQIGIDIGIPGMIFLIGLCGWMVYYSFKHQNYFLLFVMLSLIFNSLFESMLQRQSGIVFYTFVICLTVVYTKQMQLGKNTITSKI